MRNVLRGIAIVFATLIAMPVSAQNSATAPRMIKVDGVDVRVRTAGLVYLDTPDFEATREERASVLSGEARRRALGPPDLPEIPADTPAKVRPVYEQLLIEMRDDFPSARQWRQPTNVPVGVIVTARADRLRGDGAAMVKLQIKHQSEWALGSPDSLFTIAGHTGHQVHRDDPSLVVSMVRHVYLKAAAAQK